MVSIKRPTFRQSRGQDTYRGPRWVVCHPEDGEDLTGFFVRAPVVNWSSNSQFSGKVYLGWQLGGQSRD